jgi:hypothetical protein
MSKFAAGLAGGLTLNVAMLLTFRLHGFGWNGGGTRRARIDFLVRRRGSRSIRHRDDHRTPKTLTP